MFTALIAASVALPAGAGAATINVNPGNNAIQRAVNRASNGDTLRIHDGRYKDDVSVDKRLTLTDAGDGRPVIDGQCDPLRVIDIDHNRVTLKGLKVEGAREGGGTAAVNFIGIEKGTVDDLVVRDTCGGGPGSGAQYGVNVYQSEKLSITDVNGKGFSDAAIYIGAITDTGNGELVVAESNTHGNNQGIIIEDTTPDADVSVEDNHTEDNGRGIFVNNSQQVELSGNEIVDNATGVEIDAQSEDNVFTDNVFTGNGTDLVDNGTGNCGSGNTPEPFGPCV
jgi:parallel beta-helix repeat protein